MTAQDLQEIRQIIREEIRLGVREQLERILPVELDKFPRLLEKHLPGPLCKFTEEVLLPAMQNLIKEEVDPLARAVRALGGIARLVTKDYCDDKQSDLRGDVLANRKKDSARLDALIRIQQKKGYLTKQEAETLEKMRGFAPLPLEV